MAGANLCDIEGLAPPNPSAPYGRGVRRGPMGVGKGAGLPDRADGDSLSLVRRLVWGKPAWGE